MKTLLGILFLSAALAFPATIAQAADLDGQKVVGGVAVHLGVTSAATILNHASGNAERQMHGGVPTGKNFYHVMVALVDVATGKRIVGARVKAMVAEFGLGGERKVMEPMEVAGAETYGNYFKLANPGVYSVYVDIAGVAGKPSLATEFQFTR